MAMEWITAGLKAHEKAVADLDAVEEGSLALFGNLIVLIGNIVRETETQMGVRLKKPSNSEAVIEMPLNPKAGPLSIKRALEITLHENKRSIMASSDAGKLEFSILRFNDAIVGLSRDFIHVSEEEAARLIMEPFLFAGQSPFRSNL